MVEASGGSLNYRQLLTRLCGGIIIVSGSMLLFAVAIVFAESFTKAITGSTFDDMPEFLELIKHLAVILSFAIGSKYMARALGAGLKSWALWAAVLVILDTALGLILGLAFEAKDVALIIGASGIVFAAEWLFNKAESKIGRG